jgi:hypothetical protein
LLSEYIDRDSRVYLKCHCGYEWSVIPLHHYNEIKCRKCSQAEAGRIQREEKKKELMSLLETIDYEFVSNDEEDMSRAIIKHNKCGNEYSRNIARFVLEGGNCKFCTKSNIIDEMTMKINKVIEECDEFILLDSYENTRPRVSIHHKTCGRDFTRSAGEFVKDKSCTLCNMEKTAYDWYKDKPTYIYYIKIENQYKIGVVLKKYNREIEKALKYRYSSEYNKGIPIEIISYKLFEDGYEAYLLEQKIISNFSDKRITKEDMILNTGYTETFTENVLENYLRV